MNSIIKKKYDGKYELRTPQRGFLLSYIMYLHVYQNYVYDSNKINTNNN